MIRHDGLNRERGYEELAWEYYDKRHVTSRNFEAATAKWTGVHGCPIPASGLVLDIGSGRGSAAAFCRLGSDRVIEGDIASSMLTLSPRAPSMARVACDALSLPFVAESFAGMAAFLFDPFNRPQFLAESFRVLAKGGVFFGTLPDYQWGMTLRRLRGTELDVATFITAAGARVTKPSFLMSGPELRRSLTASGYQSVEVHALTLPRTELSVSPDIIEPAKSCGTDPFEFPILQVVVARKA